MRAEGKDMKRASLLIAVLAVVGCAVAVEAQTTVVVPQSPVVVGQAPAPVTGKFSGHAWTWDSARSIVTLHDGSRQFRVQTTPDTIARLNHHQWVTVTGTLLGPEPIETVLLPTEPMAAIPNGAPSSADLSGQITAIDTNGIATIESARGPLRVWMADGAQSRFQSGKPVKLVVNVQPVRMVAIAGTGGQASPTLSPPPAIPGDSAVVVGRIMALNANGTLTIESPKGPITVWVPNASNFKIGDFVQVQTVVQPA
jgi:hypothetical protein